ncbi:DUF397 domain-containing protein [Streptomyces sp. NPDC014983]|uniref:DUF397 domain-containing protein n=1 Tax=Streptomyces sp. NPDC014983 TaxID=3364933 RepID=UPI0036F98B4B
MTEQTIPNTDALTGWRKSSYSGTDNASCLEVLDGYPAGVPVRDSKVPHDPAVVFSAADWSVFVTAIKNGDMPAGTMLTLQ